MPLSLLRALGVPSGTVVAVAACAPPTLSSQTNNYADSHLASASADSAGCVAPARPLRAGSYLLPCPTASELNNSTSSSGDSVNSGESSCGASDWEQDCDCATALPVRLVAVTIPALPANSNGAAAIGTTTIVFPALSPSRSTPPGSSALISDSALSSAADGGDEGGRALTTPAPWPLVIAAPHATLPPYLTQSQAASSSNQATVSAQALGGGFAPLLPLPPASVSSVSNTATATVTVSTTTLLSATATATTTGATTGAGAAAVPAAADDAAAAALGRYHRPHTAAAHGHSATTTASSAASANAIAESLLEAYLPPSVLAALGIVPAAPHPVHLSAAASAGAASAGAGDGGHIAESANAPGHALSVFGSPRKESNSIGHSNSGVDSVVGVPRGSYVTFRLYPEGAYSTCLTQGSQSPQSQSTQQALLPSLPVATAVTLALVAAPGPAAWLGAPSAAARESNPYFSPLSLPTATASTAATSSSNSASVGASASLGDREQPAAAVIDLGLSSAFRVPRLAGVGSLFPLPLAPAAAALPVFSPEATAGQAVYLKAALNASQSHSSSANASASALAASGRALPFPRSLSAESDALAEAWESGARALAATVTPAILPRGNPSTTATATGSANASASARSEWRPPVPALAVAAAPGADAETMLVPAATAARHAAGLYALALPCSQSPPGALSAQQSAPQLLTESQAEAAYMSALAAYINAVAADVYTTLPTVTAPTVSSTTTSPTATTTAPAAATAAATLSPPRSTHSVSALASPSPSRSRSPSPSSAAAAAAAAAAAVPMLVAAPASAPAAGAAAVPLAYVVVTSVSPPSLWGRPFLIAPTPNAGTGGEGSDSNAVVTQVTLSSSPALGPVPHGAASFVAARGLASVLAAATALAHHWHARQTALLALHGAPLPAPPLLRLSLPPLLAHSFAHYPSHARALSQLLAVAAPLLLPTAPRARPFALRALPLLLAASGAGKRALAAAAATALGAVLVEVDADTIAARALGDLRNPASAANPGAGAGSGLVLAGARSGTGASLAELASGTGTSCPLTRALASVVLAAHFAPHDGPRARSNASASASNEGSTSYTSTSMQRHVPGAALAAGDGGHSGAGTGAWGAPVLIHLRHAARACAAYSAAAERPGAGARALSALAQALARARSAPPHAPLLLLSDTAQAVEEEAAAASASGDAASGGGGGGGGVSVRATATHIIEVAAPDAAARRSAVAAAVEEAVWQLHALTVSRFPPVTAPAASATSQPQLQSQTAKTAEGDSELTAAAAAACPALSALRTPGAAAAAALAATEALSAAALGPAARLPAAAAAAAARGAGASLGHLAAASREAVHRAWVASLAASAAAAAEAEAEAAAQAEAEAGGYGGGDGGNALGLGFGPYANNDDDDDSWWRGAPIGFIPASTDGESASTTPSASASSDSPSAASATSSIESVHANAKVFAALSAAATVASAGRALSTALGKAIEALQARMMRDAGGAAAVAKVPGTF